MKIPLNTDDVLESAIPGALVVPFFVLNGDLEETRMHAMVSQCMEAAFDGIILHGREGLQTPYLSEAWLRAIEFCVKDSEAHGLETWLYDEYPYPSGVAGGRVIQRNPDFAEKHLVTRAFRVKGGKKVNCTLGEGILLHAFLLPLDEDGSRQWGRAVDVTSSVGLCNSTWLASDWDSRHYYHPDYARLYDCRRSTQAFSEQVFCDDLTEGSWEILAFFQETGGEFVEPFGHYVDVSNRAATMAFLEETHVRYRGRVGSKFGTQIPGIFTDEPKYRNEFPWSVSIAEAWTEYRQNPKALLALAGMPGGENDRRTYRETASRLFLQNWVRPIRDWCRSENLKLIGHISPEEDWWIESKFAGSILRLIREFSIPGCDLIIPAVGDREHPILNLTPTLSVSAAAQSGAPFSLCETYGASDYSLDPQTLKRIGDWLATCGINFFVPHGCFYSLDGQRRFDAPPTFLPPMTLHKHLAEWSDHLRRTASALGPSSAEVDVALVRPMATIFGLAETEKAQADTLYQSAMEVAMALHERGIYFHWLDDEDLLEAIPENGELRFRNACYEKLIIFEEPRVLRHQVALESIRSASIEVLDIAGALKLQGPLHCPAGDVRAVRALNVPRFFCVNLSPEPREFSLEKKPCRLEGYESRWIATNVKSDRLPPVPFLSTPLNAQWKFTPPDTNFCRLLQWRWGPEKTFREVGPVVQALPEGSVPMTPLCIGLAPSRPTLEREVSVTYEAAFLWRGPLPSTPLQLLIEAEGISGNWSVSFNGNALRDWQVDPCGIGGIGHEISPSLLRDDNLIQIEVSTCDARDGLLLPPVLSGPFQVASLDPIFLQSQNRAIIGSDWAACGCPHFSGTVDFEAIFSWNADVKEGEAFLAFPQPPHGPVEVILNGQPLGHLLWSPWRLPLGKALQDGDNHLLLRITNSLQNFMHGEARPSGFATSPQIELFPAHLTSPPVKESSGAPMPEPTNLQAP